MGLNGSGALTGAASGAAIGSVAGPWGAAAGGVIGGAMGLFSGGDDKPTTGYQDQAQIDAQIRAGMGSANGVAPQLDPYQQQQFRQMQMQQAMQLQRIASGQQQGAGELAAQRQVQQAIQQQQGMAHMARGGQNAALAFRGAANNAAGIGLQGAGQSQQAALQDQQMAQGQLTGALGQGRSQDIGFAGQNATLAQNQYGLNTARGLGYLNADIGMNAAQNNQAFGQYNTDANNNAQLQGGMLNAAGTVLAAKYGKSDEKLKTGIRDGGDDIDEMLSNLSAKTYRYKDEAKNGAGARVGIMAGDLAKSKAGSAIVVDLPDDPGMKGFDVVKAVSAALAATARLNDRLRKVEGNG